MCRNAGMPLVGVTDGEGKAADSLAGARPESGPRVGEAAVVWDAIGAERWHWPAEASPPRVIRKPRQSARPREDRSPSSISRGSWLEVSPDADRMQGPAAVVRSERRWAGPGDRWRLVGAS